MVKGKVRVDMEGGFHLRVVGGVRKVIEKDGCIGSIEYKGEVVNLQHLMRVFRMQIPVGAEVNILVEGPNEQVVLNKALFFVNSFRTEKDVDPNMSIG